MINLNDFEITVNEDSVKSVLMSDDVYFSKEYSNYVSNSRLNLINPEQGGSAKSYKEGFKANASSSLSVGSAVHQLFLQSDEFKLAENFNKPGSKLGLVIEEILKQRKSHNIYDSVVNACKSVSYYVNSLNTKRIKTIIEKGFKYYYQLLHNNEDGLVILSETDQAKCVKCLDSLNKNKQLVNLVNPVDVFGDPITSINEDAIFGEVNVKYLDKDINIKLKMKADNWTIDEDAKVITLNDLKTTSKPVHFFMKEYGSFNKFHYNRQMGMYLWMLKQYCKKKYNTDDTWTYKCNMLVVETTVNFRAACFSVPFKELEKGENEFFKLLKMVSYYEMFGFEPEVMFSE